MAPKTTSNTLTRRQRRAATMWLNRAARHRRYLVARPIIKNRKTGARRRNKHLIHFITAMDELFKLGLIPSFEGGSRLVVKGINGAPV